MSSKPYTEILLENGNKFRVFSESVDTSDLVWHQDQHDRKIYVHESNLWSLQFDNCLPTLLEAGNVYTVPRDTWHRVIKGEGNLVIQISENVITEAKKKSSHEPQYGAPEGSKRDKQLDATKADLASGDPERVQRAYRRRERMERQERGKKGYKNKPRSDSKKESFEMSETDLRDLIREVLITEAIMNEELSKKTKATLKKKAEERGLTAGSVEQEYKKGLAAWASSGSRKGMTQHQWAMARVNSAQPSKSWAVVKKSKAKKKK
tara:strand:+ start:755 stop:1546 length:792 start_codon:yes stop_codon:yes gene_type:complete